MKVDLFDMKYLEYNLFKMKGLKLKKWTLDRTRFEDLKMKGNGSLI